jgi:hypothetical protein
MAQGREIQSYENPSELCVIMGKKILEKCLNVRKSKT